MEECASSPHGQHEPNSTRPLATLYTGPEGPLGTGNMPRHQATPHETWPQCRGLQNLPWAPNNAAAVRRLTHPPTSAHSHLSRPCRPRRRRGSSSLGEVPEGSGRLANGAGGRQTRAPSARVGQGAEEPSICMLSYSLHWELHGTAAELNEGGWVSAPCPKKKRAECHLQR